MMEFLDFVLEWVPLYRRWRGGEWFQLPCPDGHWVRVK